MTQAQSVVRPTGTSLMDDRDGELAMLEDVATHALRHARACGADSAEVSVSSGHAREATVRLGEIDVVEDARDRGVSVTIYRDRASGSASTADLSREALDEAVERAVAIARHTQSDPAGGLADPERMAVDLLDFGLWHPADLEMNDLIERAREIESVGLGFDPKVDNSEGASVSVDVAVGVYANTHGFVGTSSRTRYGQSCVLVAKDQSGMQRDYDWDDRIAFDELAGVEVTGRRAAERAVRRLGARSVSAEKVPVLFSPEVSCGLIQHLVGAASGGSLYRRASFLLDQQGNAVFPAWVNIVEDPHRAGFRRSSSFDAEGVATRSSALIRAGLLDRYVLGSYSARKLGMETTANAGGVRNLIFQPGVRSFDELVGDMQRGLVVTEVMGQGVNLVTGDYSRGASGFWVENGELAFPVEEITIAGNLRDMFLGLKAAGSDIETRRNVQVPSLLIDRMTVAGQ
jgi:PmbA protein